MLPVLVARGAEIWAWVVKGSGQVVQRPRPEGPGCSCRFCVGRGSIFQTFGLGLVLVWAESTSARTGTVRRDGMLQSWVI